jgi:hypothetical protein
MLVVLPQTLRPMLFSMMKPIERIDGTSRATSIRNKGRRERRRGRYYRAVAFTYCLRESLASRELVSLMTRQIPGLSNLLGCGVMLLHGLGRLSMNGRSWARQNPYRREA